eukprot:TRINITY_DN550_c0_g1_i2.p1 TRINITY_DN550_c0_g1~~TRINITY_DN550_c0_g1_i2.p1  ORF type:complete len:977 (+),score=335.73 TRINITY_DN550_c0_g1_i2:125-2932(+)
MQAAAVCELDECTAQCATCAGWTCSDAGQECRDADKDAVTGLNTWVCVCAAPRVGVSAPTKVAVCTLDECLSHAGTCTAAGQTCFDPDIAVAALGDWECRCAPPAAQSATGQAADCSHDECGPNGATCAAAGQDCVDGDHRTLGDWTCQCHSPWDGVGKQAPASMCTHDECESFGAVCPDGQDCADGSHEDAGDWACVCKNDAAVNATGAPALCEVDECADACATCAGSTCDDAGQTCTDMDTKAASLRDWVCACPPPTSAVPAVTSAQHCFYDECDDDAVCGAAGQECVDGNWNVNGDWACRCRHPETGNATGAAAACALDECETLGKTTCEAAGQTCEDADAAQSNDWVCRCPSPSVNFGITAPAATCALDECQAVPAPPCVAAGQLCVDPAPSPTSTDDWWCQCPLDATREFGAVAACPVDECAEHAAVCTAHGQLCTDTNRSPGALGDWACECVSGVGSQVAAPAACTYPADDECSEPSIRNVCTDAGSQYCIDPVPGVDGNWECHCLTLNAGVAGLMAPAACVLNECVAVCPTCARRANDAANVCAAAGQTCRDPNVDSTGDWVCACASVGDMEGATAPTGPADCSFDECTVPANAAVCATVGQACVDASESTRNDWRCTCVAPMTGFAVASSASCATDECLLDVAKATCGDAGQRCIDASKATSDDWQCVCHYPAVGQAVQQPAACTYPATDECGDAGNRAVCAAAGQICHDDSAEVGNWHCTCTAPTFTTATHPRAAAECGVDECVGNTVCSAGGQVCRDNDTTVEGDWMCRCVAPEEGDAVAGALAECAVPVDCAVLAESECLAHTDICAWNNGTGCAFGAAVLGGDDDGGCWWCWILVLLLVLCCCCCIVAVLFLMRVRKAAGETEDSKWTAHFEYEAGKEMDEKERSEFSRSCLSEGPPDSAAPSLAASLLFDYEHEEREALSEL